MGEDRELWKARAELRSAARELVDRTEVTVKGKDGKVSTSPAQPLLEQLRDAVSNAGGPGGKRSGTGSPELVSLVALTLLRQLEVELVTMHVNAVRDQSFTVEERIRAVVAMTNRRADVATTTASTERLAVMAAQIRDLLDPKQRNVRALCPVCGTRTVWREVDGERVQTSALSVDMESGRCVCLSCKTDWQPQHLELLLRMITDAEKQRQATEDAAAREVRSGSEGTTGRMAPGTKQCAECHEVKLVEQFPLRRPNAAWPRLRVRSMVCAVCQRKAKEKKKRDTPRRDHDGQVA